MVRDRRNAFALVVIAYRDQEQHLLRHDKWYGHIRDELCDLTEIATGGAWFRIGVRLARYGIPAARISAIHRIRCRIEIPVLIRNSFRLICGAQKSSQRPNSFAYN